MDIGYARVSTGSQSLERQVDALTRHGVDPERIYTDKKTGRDFQREGLHAALDYMREGDRLIVASLDRLGRSLPDLLHVITDLDTRGMTLISDKESIDTSTSIGRMLAGIFASLAKYEITLMHERAAEARAARRARGVPTGRPSKLTDAQRRYARYRHTEERIPASQLASELGVSRATMYRVLDLGSATATSSNESE